MNSFCSYRFLKFLVAVFSLLSVLHADNYEVPGTNIQLSYRIEGDPGSESVTISDCNRDATGHLDIPDLIEGHPVERISMGAFERCSSLTSVAIPDSVNYIESLAFQFCSSLESVNIPDGVTEIGIQLFNGCSSLSNVTIGDSVTIIEHAAFAGCSALESVTLPDTVTYIDSRSFERCFSLASINIPPTVRVIANNAFENCYSLTSVDLPVGLENIGSEAFYLTSLASVTIPASVTSIDDGAFAGCYLLTSATFEGDSPSLGFNVFEDAAIDVEADFTIYFYEGSTYYTTPTWRGYPSVMLPSPNPVNPVPLALRNAEDFGGGYYLSAWFGGFFKTDDDASNTFLFTMDFGWTWASPDGTPESLWWWCFNMNSWLWGSEGTGRFFYRNSDGVWVFVVSDENGGSWIQNTSTAEWSFLAQ